MAIEFSCPKCQHQLRTGDDKAGLSAKCPACGEIIWVPYAGGAAAASPPIGVPISANPTGTETSADAPRQGTNGGGEQPQGFAPDAQASSADVICPSCRATNDAAAERCRFCGTSLAGAQPEVESVLPPRTPEVGEVLSTAWRIYGNRFGLLIGATLLLIPLALLIVAVSGVPLAVLVGGLARADDDLAPVGLGLGLLCTIPLLLVLAAPLTIGVLQLHLNIARGTPADIGDLLYGFSREGRTLVPGMLVIVLIAMVANLVIIGPMLIWPLGYFLVHRRQPIGDTLTQFLNKLTADFAYVLLVGLIMWGVSMAVGVLIYPCCIGILLLPFTAAFTNILTAVGYLRWVGERTVID